MKRGKKIFIAVVAVLLVFAVMWTRVQAAESGDTIHVLAFGDSLTAGYGLDPELAYPAVLEEIAKREGFAVQVRNAGLSGETSAGGLRRLNWVLRQPVDILLLGLGANDALRGIDPQTTEANLRAMIARTREAHPQAQILLLRMLAPPNLGREYAQAFDGLFARIAEEEGVILGPFLLEDVAGIPELNLADGIHPNREGQRVIARNLWPYLRKTLSGSPEGR